MRSEASPLDSPRQGYVEDWSTQSSIRSSTMRQPRVYKCKSREAGDSSRRVASRLTEARSNILRAEQVGLPAT